MRKIRPQSAFTLRTLNLSVFIALLMIAKSAFASTNHFHSSDEIQETAKIFLEKMTSAADNSNISVNVNELDPRLRLRKCEQALQTSLSKSSNSRGKVTVSVSCELPVAWKIFISAEIAEYAEVIVAARSLARKTTITKDDITRKNVNIARLRKSPLLQESLVIGSTTKRNINQGKLIYNESICMVCRGDHVQITAKSDFFSINLEAVALSDASIGETTVVRNKQSKRSFSAKVISRDHLEVTL